MICALRMEGSLAVLPVIVIAASVVTHPRLPGEEQPHAGTSDSVLSFRLRAARPLMNLKYHM
jgi:hypothetical protein